MKRVLIVVVLAVMAVATPAQAHTDAELHEWQLGWFERVEAGGGSLSMSLMAELLDMRERHPCRTVIGTWTDACERTPTPSHTHSARSSNPPGSAGTGMGTNVEQWRGLVEGYFGDYTDEALRVMACESGGNPNAKNPRSSASGLFQVLGGWADRFGYARSDLFVPEVNVSIAKRLFDDGASRGNRWSHWVCKP